MVESINANDPTAEVAKFFYKHKDGKPGDGKQGGRSEGKNLGMETQDVKPGNARQRAKTVNLNQVPSITKTTIGSTAPKASQQQNTAPLAGTPAENPKKTAISKLNQESCGLNEEEAETENRSDANTTDRRASAKENWNKAVSSWMKLKVKAAEDDGRDSNE
ncbi:hypothetical protein ONZ45_g13309 [Pleurotus djamor]|nr:hypothetical protein ONZ45_g13309 [Pleurotus djamor]